MVPGSCSNTYNVPGVIHAGDTQVIRRKPGSRYSTDSSQITCIHNQEKSPTFIQCFHAWCKEVVVHNRPLVVVCPTVELRDV